MARTLDSFDSGSNYKFNDKLQKPQTPRSLFDLSHLSTMTIDNAGEIVPLSVLETVPGDSFELSVKSLVRVLPQVVPLMSRQRLYIHAFYSRLSDLWPSAQVFMTKGYQGVTIKAMPVLNADNVIIPGGPTPDPNDVAVTPGSVFDYMGLPIGMTYTNLYEAGINALPFMMLHRIYRDYFLKRNFYMSSREWLPDDDHDFMINDTGRIISDPDFTVLPRFGTKFYRNYPDDYFLSAFPSPQRGETPTLDFGLSVDDVNVGINVDGEFRSVNQRFYRNSGNGNMAAALSGNSDPYNLAPHLLSISDGRYSFPYVGTGIGLADDGDPNNPENMYSYVANMSDLVARSTISLNQLRELSSQQQILEKMARTDGSYGEFGLTFFGRQSKSAIDYRPLYIGGTYQPISFTEVLQTTPTDDSPLGTYAGHGMSYDSSGYIGRVDCDDYGYIMLVASFMPDIYYSQGLDRLWTRSLQSDMYLPERSRLGMREILNKELYFSGSLSQDNGLFAYQTPFDEFRYKPSVIHGKIADPNSEDFYPYTQARHFDSLPTYSASFGVADDVRKDYLAAYNEHAYICQFSIGCRAVRPIPYNPVPAQLL